MNQIQMKEVSEVRDLVIEASRERLVPEEAAQSARDTIQIMYQEAAKFGLSKADVVRAIFRPALGNRKTATALIANPTEVD